MKYYISEHIATGYPVWEGWAESYEEAVKRVANVMTGGRPGYYVTSWDVLLDVFIDEYNSKPETNK